ncbi:hypothetical protein EJ110_NYTH13879 [Nymphaea thermarum]|nr:hypothetical protein EJ110_NYTH13879 [Nymphaea thermarum]
MALGTMEACRKGSTKPVATMRSTTNAAASTKAIAIIIAITVMREPMSVAGSSFDQLEKISPTAFDLSCITEWVSSSCDLIPPWMQFFLINMS